MSKSIKLVCGVRNLRPEDFKLGTKVMVSGDPNTDSCPECEDQFYIVTGQNKWPLQNLSSGEQINWSIAKDMKLEPLPPGSALVIEIPLDKIKLRLRNKYGKRQRNGTTTQV